MGRNSGDIMQRVFCKAGDSYKPADIDLMEVDCACPINLDYFSAAQRERLEYELQMASSVQRALLPQPPVDIPGFDTGHSPPAAGVCW